MKKERIFYLDFIKVISTILILVYHFYKYLEHFCIEGIDKIFYYTINGTEHGAIALNGLASFFIISGVALMYQYSEKINYKEYAIKRFKSIYPMFWIAYICVALYDYFIMQRIFGLPLYKFLLTIVGIDGYFMFLSPNFYKVGEWFLGAMIFLYILFPLCRKIIKKNKKIATITIIILAILTMIVLTYYPFKMDYKRNILVCFFLFMLGIYFAEYIKDVKWYQALILLVLYIIFRTVNFSFLDGKFQIYIPAVISFFLFVYVSKFITNKFIKKVFEVLSKYSYAIFLLHSFVIKEVLTMFEGKTLSNIEGIGVFFIIVAIIAILSKLLYMLTSYIMKKIQDLKNKRNKIKLIGDGTVQPCIRSKKNFLLNNLPFLVYSVLMIILHIKMDIMGDDAFAIRILEQTGFYEWISIRYNIWTSRIIIDVIMIILLECKYVIWKIFNIAMFILLPYSINRIFNDKNDLKFKWLICIITLLIPAACYGGAGWAVTSINYMWPLIFGILACIPIKKNFKNEKMTIVEKVLSVLFIIIASNNEQMAGILAILYGITLIYNLIKKNKNNWILLYTALVLLSLIFIFTCPGNGYRSIAETRARFPIFENFNLVDKIELGFTSMMNAILLENNLVFLTTTFIIIFAVFVTNKSKIFRMISIIPFLASVIPLNSIYRILPNKMIILKEIIGKINTETLLSQLFNDNIFYFCIVLAYYLIFLISIIISLYAIFKNTNKSIFVIILFGVGVISRIALGFSPTVYASGERTSLFLYASCIIIIIYIWKYLRDLKKDDRTIDITILTICLIAYVQNILNIFNLLT